MDSAFFHKDIPPHVLLVMGRICCADFGVAVETSLEEFSIYTGLPLSKVSQAIAWLEQRGCITRNPIKGSRYFFIEVHDEERPDWLNQRENALHDKMGAKEQMRANTKKVLELIQPKA